ncbi:hypothetical protein PGT21_031411 [Puccinia graminis f. sp. tritici]|uniref:Uncharacterized protein n=1 Tax=Puccinia graminis f. sp. tritici TaxID=56615 RepID=A0A5B0MTG4_PUCGR|nr:hypothetical protein PGTUg99_010661 [Puccinia graminis f. sp. tritici]KAA1094850.1 hypothetical protein PGT21_031411 [Puccinia graminis f. sp. tritici]
MIKPKQHSNKPEHEQEQEQGNEQEQEQEQESGSGSYIEVIDPKNHSQLNPTSSSSSSSSPIEPPGSPRSIISWHQSDLVSIPNSSQPTSDFDDRSDDDDHHNQQPPNASSSAIQTGEQPFNNHPHQANHHHHLTAELLTAITDHLVMPRLPMIPSPSNQSSRPVSCRGRSSTSESAASLHHHRNNDNNTTNKHHHHSYRPTHFDPLISYKHSHLTQHPTNSHPYPIYPSRTLVVGEAQEGLGIGPLRELLSSSFLTSIDRTDDILPDFKFSDPQTYNQLIQHLEAPFYRLKGLLNPKACYPYQSSSTTPARRNDLLCLVDRWIEREGYLLLLVEIDLFPVPPVRLEFLRTLSRLIPTIPFIPSTVSIPQAIDGHAILTRQLAANRLRHFPIPDPSSPHSFALPEREECVKRSSRACVDWLAVEFASHISSSSSTSSHEADPVGGVERRRFGGDDEGTDEFEPDKISERVGRRLAKKRALARAEKRPSRKSSMVIVDEHPLGSIRDCQGSLSSDGLGLPSLTALFRLGLRQLRRDSRRLFNSFLSRLVHSPRPPIFFTPHPPSLRDNNGRQIQSRTTSRKPASAKLPDRLSTSIHPLPHPSNKPILHPLSPPPSPPSPTTWLIIGFLTATTAATLTVWWKQTLLV